MSWRSHEKKALITVACEFFYFMVGRCCLDMLERRRRPDIGLFTSRQKREVTLLAECVDGLHQVVRLTVCSSEHSTGRKSALISYLVSSWSVGNRIVS